MHHDQPADPAAPTERPAGSRNAAPDPLDAFPTEAQVAASLARRERRRRSITTGLLAVAGGAVVIALSVWLLPGAVTAVRRGLGLTASSAEGMLAIDTTPSGWDVLEGARTLGTTPLRVSLPPGPHSLVLRNGSVTRPLNVILPAGMQVFHHLDLQEVASGGVLSIATVPPGAAVDVDGVRRGVSPLDVSGLSVGEHAVAVTTGNGTVTERVTIASGRTTELVVPLARVEGQGNGVGFVTIAAPIELQVFDGDSLVGSSRNQRIILMPGRRTLRLANQELGFERSMGVTVEAGAVARLTVPVPNGTVSVNAVPWAEVVLDGRVIGETPIANLAVPLGSHEIVLRNPKFPEQRRTIVVSLVAPTRIGVDLRQ
jgi:eukaryotic-like serine/threonine-protein kinase